MVTRKFLYAIYFLKLPQMTINIYPYKSGSRSSGTNLSTKNIFDILQAQNGHLQVFTRKSLVKVPEMTTNVYLYKVSHGAPQ